MIAEPANYIERVSFTPLLALLLSFLIFAVIMFFPSAFVILAYTESDRWLGFMIYLFIAWLISPYLFFFAHLYFYIKRKLSVTFWTISAFYYFISILTILILLFQNTDFLESSIILYPLAGLAFAICGFIVSLYYRRFSRRIPHEK